MIIDFINVELSEEYVDDDNVSYWVSGQLKVDGQIYDLQGSIDSWNSLDYLNSKFSEDAQISENDFENKENKAEDTFETDSNSWIINIEASHKDGFLENIQMYNTPHFDPYSGSLSRYVEDVISSKNLSKQLTINSILKAVFIDWFSNEIDTEEKTKIYDINI